MKNGPDLWDAILRQMPVGAIVAGGAVRDFLLKVEPKDIDVFIAGHEWPVDYAGFSRLGPDRDSEYASMNEILMIRRGTLGGYQVDLVGIDTGFLTQKWGTYPPLTGAELVTCFDFGITRCWYDGEIHVTPEFDEDVLNMTVTVLKLDKPERAAARFERFNSRWCGAYRLERPIS